jgi:phosphoglucosamine mutase
LGKLFGTDGIRGIAGKYPLDPKTVNIIATAASLVLRTKDVYKHPVLIGRDTRQSGQDIAAHLKKGLAGHGVDVWDMGVVPTPCVAYLVKKYPALAGIVVSASHNPYEYNGIKFFSHKGIKLSDSVEQKIEQKINELCKNPGLNNKKAKK